MTNISIWHPAVARLKEAVEKTFGEQILPTNAQRFASDVLSSKLGVDTIRLLWGYRTNKNHAIRHATLDILSQYVGYTDWENFLKHINRDSDSQLTLGQTKSPLSNIDLGRTIVISWGTNRTARLRYEGNNHYVILEVHNSQLLHEGDEFNCYQWIVGETAFLTNLIHDGKPVGNYQIGVHGGLSAIHLE